MTTIAVVAHIGSTLGGGLEELREVLAAEGVTDPQWHEVSDIRAASERARRARKDGADLVFVWGGDGTLQRCIDGLAHTGATIAIMPAGTANLLAANLGIPTDLRKAVEIGLHGVRRPLDTGSVNGEHFAVMAGAGFDALTVRDADSGLKSSIGSAAYLWSGALNFKALTVGANIVVDGERFFQGELSCVLTANVGKLLGGIEAFENAQPDDGILELAVITAKNRIQWTRTLGRVALGSAGDSPFVEVTRGRRFEIRFAEPFLYELDGDPRKAVRRLRVAVDPGSITICVPSSSSEQGTRP
jgi:YegS/Rv2252/BmrU family lipid kinase